MGGGEGGGREGKGAGEIRGGGCAGRRAGEGEVGGVGEGYDKRGGCRNEKWAV